MASIINAATSGGLISTGDTSGQLQLQTAGTTALTVTSGQLVGIGTGSPSVKLDVVGQINNTGGVLFGGSDSSGSTGKIQYLTGSGLTLYSKTGSSYDFTLLGAAGNNIMRIPTGTINLSFPQAGVNFTANGIGLGGTSPSSGTGIAFPATQSASSDANTLDDYEEGSWTLTITPGSGSFTVANNTGYYVKIGKVVYINMWWRRIGESGLGGGLTLGGFPFPFESNSTDTARQRLWVTGYAFSSLTNRSFMIVVPDGGGSATTGVLSTGGTDYSGGQNINASNMTGVNTEVYINGFYMTNT